MHAVSCNLYTTHSFFIKAVAGFQGYSVCGPKQLTIVAWVIKSAQFLHIWLIQLYSFGVKVLQRHSIAGCNLFWFSTYSISGNGNPFPKFLDSTLLSTCANLAPFKSFTSYNLVIVPMGDDHLLLVVSLQVVNEHLLVIAFLWAGHLSLQPFALLWMWEISTIILKHILSSYNVQWSLLLVTALFDSISTSGHGQVFNVLSIDRIFSTRVLQPQRNDAMKEYSPVDKQPRRIDAGDYATITEVEPSSNTCFSSLNNGLWCLLWVHNVQYAT